MLSCLLNGQRINCYDGTYNKEQLKKWAAKKILLCPACGKPYEYCHGKVKSPYFRHMDKVECVDKYSEPETEEHMTGKRDLYEWIRKQPGVTDAVLEGWMPGTKQRPDIMFMFNGKQYVIEYQCSPIATEYEERHELYQAAGVIDIWVCGIEKYFTNSSRKKHMDKVCVGYYDPKNNAFINSNGYMYLNYRYLIPEHCYYQGEPGRPLEKLIFKDGHVYDQELFEIKEKRKKRQSLRDKYRNSKNKYHEKHGFYLEKQDDRLIHSLSCNLKKLSNSNWYFGLEYAPTLRRPSYNIYAKPVFKISYYGYDYPTTIDERKKEQLEKKYRKINLWKISDEKYKKCCKDIEYLKKLLTPVMRSNRKKLLNCDFHNIRILEECKE